MVTAGWWASSAGSLMAVVGVVGLELIIRYYAGDHGIGRGWQDAGTHLFTYICFLMLGVDRYNAAQAPEQAVR